MGGGGQSSTTQETKEVRLPPWVEQASQENYGFAKDVANRPYAAYGGETVAPMDILSTKARGLQSTLDDYQRYYGEAGQALHNIMTGTTASGWSTPTVTAQMLPGMDRAAYTNPFINEVEQRAIDNARTQGLTAQRDLAAAATKGGGMGGSRQAVQAAVQGAETARGIGDLSAELRQRGYDQATQAMMADAARKLQADTTTTGYQQQMMSETERNKLQAAQIRAEAAKSKAGIADQAQQSRMNQIATLLGLGQMKQEQTQRVLDSRKAKWEDRWNYPLEQLNIRLAALGMSPYGHTETGTSTTRQSGGGGGIGQALGIGAQLLGMFSDREDKTDIEELGEHPILPLPIYAYRYKKDPKTYPKVIGPMAQDVEKIAPHAVRKIGGHRIIDLTQLTV